MRHELPRNVRSQSSRIRKITPTESQRLLHAAVEPFEAGSAHPPWSARHCSGNEVQGPANADAGRNRKPVAMHGNPFFLLWIAKRDQEDIGPCSVDPTQNLLVVHLVE